MSLSLNFQKGTVKQDLAMLPDKMLEAAFEAIDEAADFMVTIAKGYCLVDTGALQKSIRKERVPPTHEHHRVVRVRAGGYVVNPKTGRLVNYAVHVEKKNPFMKPAFDTVKSFLKDQIRQKVLERCKVK